MGYFLFTLCILLTTLAGCNHQQLTDLYNNDDLIKDFDSNVSNPKVFMAWNPAENMGYDLDFDAYNDATVETRAEILASHDLMFTFPEMLQLTWLITPKDPYAMLSNTLVDFKTDEPALDDAFSLKEAILKRNPDFKLLAEIHLREHYYTDPSLINASTPYWEYGALPPDSPFWLLDDAGNKIPSWGEDLNDNGIVEPSEAQAFLIDFTNEDYQDLVVQKALALYNSGVFDGVFFDWWSESHHTLTNIDYTETYMPLDTEIEARIAILRKIRDVLPEDFLIIVNTNYDTIPQTGQYINGMYMECFKDLDAKGYGDEQLRQMESTLLWGENNLREPILNCLEGWRDVDVYNADLSTRIDERNTPANLQHMRMLTALVLTHSDGYVLFSDNNAQPTTDHLHNYYDFWLSDLGNPITDKGTNYLDYKHVFVRFYENGYVIYNGSASPIDVDGNEVDAYDGYIHLINS